MKIIEAGLKMTIFWKFSNISVLRLRVVEGRGTLPMTVLRRTVVEGVVPYQRIYIIDRPHSIPQRLPKIYPRNLSLLCL